MTLRQAAEAVVTEWEGDPADLYAAMDTLRDALSEPDPLAEAVEIIKDLLRPSETYGFRYAIGVEDKARDFLAKLEATK